MATNKKDRLSRLRANDGQSKSFAPPSMKDFILTEKLGQGTYATVYKAYKKGNTRDIVAIKCVKKSSLSKSSTENLLREIEILKSLNHRHIVELKDFQWDDNNIFLILEYCSGGDLSTYIRRYRRLPENVAGKFLRQLASALQYIHDKNISHMDLKPQNLLIESKDNLVLKVGDFGFAQYLLGKEGHDNLRGSPLYMAVEMFSSESYDASVDLWSTGVILFETLFGYAPFASATFGELELKILSNDDIKIPEKPNITPKCKDLLQRLLQRNPSQRISFQDFFNHPFVDIEHAPGPKCLQKAIDKATEAVKLDGQKDYRNAIKFYCFALEYFLPAIDYEEDIEKKAAMRLKVKQYINRAEQLKVHNKQIEKRTLERSLSGEDILDLVPGFSQALKHAENGEKYDDERQYGKALDEYYKGAEICMTLLSNIEKGSRFHKHIREKAEQMLGRAEELTRYRDIISKEQDSRLVTNCCVQ